MTLFALQSFCFNDGPGREHLVFSCSVKKSTARAGKSSGEERTTGSAGHSVRGRRPSAMATELLMMSQNSQRWPEWLPAVFIVWFASSIIIYFASGLRRFLSEKGLIAIEQLMAWC